MTTQLPTASPVRADRPYVGLDNYSERYAEVFFGRERDTQTLVANLRASRFTLLYAQSGVGKSSLLRAGVVSELRELADWYSEDGDAPRYLPVVWSDWSGDPEESVAAAVLDAAAPNLDAERGERPPRDLYGVVEQVTAAAETTLLVILDQFEEFFVHNRRQEDQQGFAEAIGRCVRAVDLPVNFLVSIREDAYATLGNLFRGHVPDVYGNYLHLAPLGVDDARDAIVEPLRLFGATIEPELVDAVLDGTTRGGGGEGIRDARRNGGAGGRVVAAPYLQLVMKRIWETEQENGSKVLRLETLERQLGGTKKIIERHLTDAMRDLSESQKEVAADALRYLAPSDRGKLTLSVRRLAEFTGHSEDELTPVLRHLHDERILATGVADSYELFHDVLASDLIAWRGAREKRRLEAVKEEEREKTRRAQREEERQRRLKRGFVALAAIFLGVAVFAVAQYVTVRQQRIESQSRRLASNAPELPTLSLSSLYALEAWRKAHTDDARRALLRIADNHQLGRPMPGMDRVMSTAVSPGGTLVAAGSFDRGVRIWSFRTHRLLTPALGRGHGSVESLAFSPNGKTLATAASDGAVRLWRVADHRLMAKLAGTAPAKGELPPGVHAVAFAPGGKRLAAGLGDGTIQLWNVPKRRRIGKPLRGHTAPVSAVSFSRDGRLASVSCDKSHLSTPLDYTLRLWNLAKHRKDGRPITSDAPMCDVTFSPNGKRLATASDDHKVRLWSARTHRQVGRAMGHGGIVSGVAFSPDGKVLASTSRDRTVRLWNVGDPAQLGTPLTTPFSSHEGAVNDVAFGPSGRTLVSAGLDSVRAWSVAGPRNLGATVHADVGPLLLGVAYSGDGRRVGWTGGGGIVVRDLAGAATPAPRKIEAVAYDRTGKPIAWHGDPGTIHARTAAGKRELLIKTPTGNINNLAFTRDGNTIAWAVYDPDPEHKNATVRILDLRSGREVVIADPGRSTKGVALSRDGRTLAYSASRVVKPVPLTVHAELRLWDVRRHRPLAVQPPVHPDEDHGIAFSRDGRVVAYGGDDRTVRIWDVRHHRLLAQMKGHRDTILGMAFSRDGKTLASSGRDERVILWDVADRRQLGLPLLRRATIYGVSFSPDGKTLAAGGGDDDVQLWDVKTHRPVGPPLTGHTDIVFGVAFSPVGRSLASVAGDGTVRFWKNYTRDYAIGRLCSYVDRRNAASIWKQIEPTVDFEKPCG